MPGSDLGADFNFDIPAVTDSPAAVAATPAEPVSVAAVADLPMEIDGIDFDSLSAVSGMAESAPVTAAVPEPLPDFDLPELTAPEPAPVAEPAAIQVASSILDKVEALRFDHDPLLRCSVSIGVAEPVADDPSLRAWMEAADHALYRAKAAGRNRIASFDGTRLRSHAEA